MILLIDIGNTRIKWATLAGATLSAQHAQPHAGWDESQFAAHITVPHANVDRVLISNVGGARMGDVARSAIKSRWGLEPEFVVSTAEACGVRNSYPVPGNLGVDRWLGIIAAHAHQRRLTCIVGVGTAMTIDAVDAAGQHLGGVIVPGPDLMVSSLLRNTSDIASKAREGIATTSLLANNTLGAIRQGASHALAALVDRTMGSIRQEANVDPALLLTGGAVAAIESLISWPHESVPDLVLRGLARYSASSG